MIEHFIKYFEYRGIPAALADGALVFGRHRVPLRNGIPRFTPDISYASGNFSRLREHHPRLQLDSYNETTDRYNTILERTKWPASFFRGKTVLECGCGVGPDTEILLALEARVVAVDLTSLDTARANLGLRDELCLVQADITDLPLTAGAFDIVFCHRVLQHTPDPSRTLRHILRFVKPDGSVFIHSYARTLFQMCTWKYLLRPFTSRMNAQRLYAIITRFAPAAFALTSFIATLPRGRLINHFLIPFRNHRNHPPLKNVPYEMLLEYGIHDTFDSLSPKYDRPLSAGAMAAIAREMLYVPFEVAEYPTVTLLRTLAMGNHGHGEEVH